MPLITPDRRGFLKGLGALFAAPAIVRASSLMAISPFDLDKLYSDPFGLSHARMRDLLLPGLRGIAVDYSALERAWGNVFKFKAAA